MDTEDDDKRNPPDPTITFQPPTVIQPRQKEIEEILAKIKRQLLSEDFRDAQQTLNRLLQSHPHLESAIALQEEVHQAASRYLQNILDQGLQHYAECDWDTAIVIWKKTLALFPNDPTTKEWIHKAEVKKEQERIVRAGLMRELEKCGKSLSNRNFVVAEEQLEELKDRFTTGYRLTDLQKIYEALVVRTRVGLEREFQDLRENIIESPETPGPVPTKEEPKSQTAVPLKEYMNAFDSGKRFFDKSDWQNALNMWHKAREINPSDNNLGHWIALAESHVREQTVPAKQSPVRSTFAFLSVFFVTALLVYLGYGRYKSYDRETKNHELIQRAMEHYRAGHLEESWKILQIYVLQDPDNESARQLLEKLTFEMRVRQTMEKQQNEINLLMQAADQQKALQRYDQAMESYNQVLKIDASNLQARRNLEELKSLTQSKESVQKVQNLLTQTEDLWKQRVQTERVAAQIDVARYLSENGQKDAAAMILRRIQDSDPSHAQAKQLLAKIRTDPVAPLFSAEIRIQPNAHLFVDGRDMGTRDQFQLMETSGRHILHIERLGYHSIDQAIEVKPGEKNLFSFQLKPY